MRLSVFFQKTIFMIHNVGRRPERRARLGVSQFVGRRHTEDPGWKRPTAETSRPGSTLRGSGRSTSEIAPLQDVFLRIAVHRCVSHPIHAVHYGEFYLEAMFGKKITSRQGTTRNLSPERTGEEIPPDVAQVSGIGTSFGIRPPKIPVLVFTGLQRPIWDYTAVTPLPPVWWITNNFTQFSNQPFLQTCRGWWFVSFTSVNIQVVTIHNFSIPPLQKQIMPRFIWFDWRYCISQDLHFIRKLSLRVLKKK